MDVQKTIVLGVTEFKRTLTDLLALLARQQLKYFDKETVARDWLTIDHRLSSIIDMCQACLFHRFTRFLL